MASCSMLGDGNVALSIFGVDVIYDLLCSEATVISDRVCSVIVSCVTAVVKATTSSSAKAMMNTKIGYPTLY